MIRGNPPSIRGNPCKLFPLANNNLNIQSKARRSSCKYFYYLIELPHSMGQHEIWSGEVRRIAAESAEEQAQLTLAGYDLFFDTISGLPLETGEAHWSFYNKPIQTVPFSRDDLGDELKGYLHDYSPFAVGVFYRKREQRRLVDVIEDSAHLLLKERERLTSPTFLHIYRQTQVTNRGLIYVGRDITVDSSKTTTYSNGARKELPSTSTYKLDEASELDLLRLTNRLALIYTNGLIQPSSE